MCQSKRWQGAHCSPQSESPCSWWSSIPGSGGVVVFLSSILLPLFQSFCSEDELLNTCDHHFPSPQPDIQVCGRAGCAEDLTATATPSPIWGGHSTINQLYNPTSQGECSDSFQAVVGYFYSLIHFSLWWVSLPTCGIMQAQLPPSPAGDRETEDMIQNRAGEFFLTTGAMGQCSNSRLKTVKARDDI